MQPLSFVRISRLIACSSGPGEGSVKLSKDPQEIAAFAGVRRLLEDFELAAVFSQATSGLILR